MWLWTVVVLWASLFAVVAVHELGHVVAARLAGFPVPAAGLGLARPVVRVRLFGTVFYLAAVNPLQGVAFALPPFDAGRARLTFFYGGGILANVAAAVASFAAAGIVPGPDWSRSWWTFGAVNAAFAVCNLVPHSVRLIGGAVRSDGEHLRRALFRPPMELRAAAVISSFRAFEQLWAEIGVPDLVRLHRVLAARGWLVLRNRERAAELLAAAGDDGDLHLRLARAELATLERRLADAEAGYLAVRNEHPDQRDALGIDLLIADHFVRVGDLPRARATLSAIGSADIDSMVPWSRLGYEALGYACGLTDDPPPLPDDTGTIDPATWIRALGLVARRAAAEDRWADVEAVCERSFLLLRMVLNELGPDDQPGVEPLRGLIRARYVEALESQGKPAAEPEAPAVLADEPPDPRAEARRFGLALGLLAALGVAVAFAVMKALDARKGDMDDKWFAASLFFYALAGIVVGTPAVAAAVVPPVVSWFRGGGPTRYGSRALRWAVLAHAVAGCVGLRLWLTK